MDPDSYIGNLASLCDGITVMTPSVGAIVALILAVMLLYASGFVSASEIAFFSLTPNDLNHIHEEEHPSDKRISMLLDDSEYLLATILISNNFVNVTIIMLLNYFFMTVIDFGNAVILEFLLITVVLTFLLLLFGEIMPKIYSTQHTLKFCRKAAPVVFWLRRFFAPLSSLLVHSSFFINKFISKKSQNISVDQLSQALELTDKNEISEESKMLKGIIRFGEETVKEVMTPRMDIVDLDLDTSFSDVLKCVVDTAYSRIPIYQENRDNIKGVLYIKDLLPYLECQDDFKWQNLIRPAYFVPETKMIDDLLRDFQKEKIHIAIVVDEFGGTSGIVTMEDIIEEIVGEINDEYDDDTERMYVKITDNVYVFEAKTLLTDFYRILQMDPDEFDSVEGDADTLAGLLLELKGEFPSLHERISYKNYVFEILALDARRILKVKIIINPAAA